MRVNVLIVEDEDLAVRKLCRLLAEADARIVIQGVTGSIEDTVQWLQTNPAPDLIFMDIELADGQSFQIFDQTPVSSPIIFTTAYDQYAIRAFKVNSIDYLLKPVQKSELRAALDKFSSRQAPPWSGQPDSAAAMQLLVQELHKQLQPKPYRQRFLVHYANRLLSVDTYQIACFFTDTGLNQFQTFEGKKMIIDYSLDDLETMLDPTRFFRVNRSFIVAIDSINQIEPYFGNRLALKLNPPVDKDVVVSREKLTPFKEWMGK